MSDEVMVFIVNALRAMNYDVEGVDADTALGPAGIDLESLAVVELSFRIEDQYGARFNEEDTERMATMTLGEFATEILQRSTSPATDPLPALDP